MTRNTADTDWAAGQLQAAVGKYPLISAADDHVSVHFGDIVWVLSPDGALAARNEIAETNADPAHAVFILGRHVNDA